VTGGSVLLQHYCLLDFVMIYDDAAACTAEGRQVTIILSK